MAIIKCKMCGGDLEVVAESRVAVCEYCGTQQTVPSADNEKKLTLFGRANRLRMACEFDKAAGVYESIVADFPEEAEAYWGLVLCKYGIEYVDDPATGKKIPTCHRSSFDSIMDDSNLEQALENADAIARRVYRDEAKAIEELRKGIIEVSGKEEPYDIFICYKETDDSGDRTIDSVIAQEVYDALTEKGYRVFFSRITLEDKLGQEYEPYIFAALHSAKIMLAFGTDYEYYNAVWVKNEWSRFLQLIAAGEKKTLIPCYKNIDAYDMPKEFARLQAQDMGKVGAMQDLLRGIEKILPREKQVVKETVVVQANSALTKRGFFFLEDGDFKSADEYFERALDENPEDSKAYVGKVLVGLRLSAVEEIGEKFVKLYGDKNFERAIRFASAEDKKVLEEIKDSADKKWMVKCLCAGLCNIAKQKKVEEQARIEEEKRKAEAEARLEAEYQLAAANAKNAKEIADLKKAVAMLKELGNYKDSQDLIELCYERIEEIKQVKAEALQDANYASAKMWMAKAKKESDYSYAARLFSSLGNFKDSAVLADKCLEKAEEARLEERRLITKRAYGSLVEQHDALAEKRDNLTEQRNGLTAEQQTLQTELSNLKGLFTGKRRKEIEKRLSEISKNTIEIDTELQSIPMRLADAEKRLAQLEREMEELG